MRPAMVLTACALYLFISLSARAQSLLLESAHFLHGSEQRVAAQFGVHLVKHFAHGVDDAEVWQTVFEERVDGLLVGRVEHGRMLFGRFEAVPGQVPRGERLVVERLERPRGRLRPIACGGDVSRSGADRPRAIGRRMSGGEACAMVAPSRNSTMECTMDCGCTVTSMRLGGTSNSRLASMTSRPLFISVDELMVTTGPMFHVGWFRPVPA